MRSKAARAHIAEGTRLFALAGRPTKAQFVKVYGPQGPKMTWEQRAKAGVDAKHFDEALKAKSLGETPRSQNARGPPSVLTVLLPVCPSSSHDPERALVYSEGSRFYL